MKIYKLSKSVLRISNDITKFFQGLATNDLEKNENAFIDRFGKIVITFEQIRLNDNEVLIAVENSFLQKLNNHLSPFLKFSKTKISAEIYGVYYDLQGDYAASKNEYKINKKIGKLILTNNKLKTNISDEDFTLFRLKNNMPTQGIDYNHELLLNVNNDDYASYTKGCFLGYEIIARVHNLAKPTKKLTTVYELEVDEKLRDKITSKVYDPLSKKVMGFIFIDNPR